MCKDDEREDGDDDGEGQTGRVEADVEEQDIDDHRAEQRKAERDEAAAQQEQPADHLEGGDGIDVTANKESSEKCAGLTFRRRHLEEVQEEIQSEDGEDESEKEAGEESGDFHNGNGLDGWLELTDSMDG